MKTREIISLKEIEDLKDNHVVTFSNKAGMSNVPKFQILKNINRFTDETHYYVVTRQGILNYFGNALIASYEGKENVDYFRFKNASQVYSFLNK